MRYTRVMVLAAMAAGIVFSAGTARAEDYYRDYRENRDIRNDRRDLRHDYSNVDRLRAQIAADRYRLNEDLRYGRRWAARADQRALDRDQRILDNQLRDIHHDRRDLYWDRH